MFHKLVLTIVFAFAVGLVGCRSCWGPYDHCQPTFVPEAGDQCMGELYRNGSILGGMERRGEGCGSCGECSTCFGDSQANFADYEEGPHDGQEMIQPQSFSEAGPSEALPPLGGQETIPTPQPNSSAAPDGDRGSIEDFLPSNLNSTDFSLGGEEI